ncbi:MAG: biotin-dependent carboxyltransferase family protein [Oscillospiraceae bacterium]|nr:biotin-dependent carboxyltransferase family protein [Oscillospiraceae bacterium]
MIMKVITPGPLSTIQDGGRFGYMSTGFGSSGAMDLRAMRIANILVGNHTEDGVIEMTMVGLSAEFTCESVIALTGADMQPKLNGVKIPMYRSIRIQPGDKLTLGVAKTGIRGYLAVAGGFDIAPVMGSMSTNLKVKSGGWQGRKLQAGDQLPLRRSADITRQGTYKCEPENDYPQVATVRVMLGPQEDYFTQTGIGTFLSAKYKVSEQSDRMGVRLDGKPIENKNGVDIISDGIAYGSVQIPASGTPIIMMADRQTTGGYAKIATVITADLYKVAQAKPGSYIRFKAVTEKEAVAALKAEKAFYDKLQYQTYFAR